MYINASSTISHQPTFGNKGFSAIVSALDQSSDVQHPDYSTFIPAMNRRRMTEVLKMAIACTADCLEQSGLKQPDAIIVGTSMGCNHFTKIFLDNIIASQAGLISPTSFMLSTHNTIAGQLSLYLGNQQYNMTHTQNSLSFEQALLDAILCIREGCNHVLAGAADEMENVLYNMNARLNIPNIHTTCGASFFILSAEKSGIPSIKLVDVGSFGLIDDWSVIISEFLQSNRLSATEVDLLLYSCKDENKTAALSSIFPLSKLIDYEKITGCYFTNSAFAMNYAADILSYEKHPLFGDSVRRVLICNNLIPENLGLILLETK